MDERIHGESMSIVKALLITGYGVNCEEEMAAAFRLSGAEERIIHINDLFSEKVSIHDFDVLNFPGGFSFGDDIASGKVLANKIRYKKLPSGKTLLDNLKDFIGNGNFVLGVCNGFQVLVRLGLLPNVKNEFEPEATLLANDTGRFINDWAELKIDASTSPFLSGMDNISLPIRHGEGKLFFRDMDIKKKVVELELNCITYKQNPNGSELDCAGLCDPSGRVLGLMPHPEAFLSIYNHPDWPRFKYASKRKNDAGEGLQIFTNIVNYIKNERIES